MTIVLSLCPSSNLSYEKCGGTHSMKSFIVFSLLAAAFAVPTPSEWSNWSECSATCGTATKTRSRPCVTTDCVGETTEIVACDLDECENEPHNGKCPLLTTEELMARCPNTECETDTECADMQKCCRLSCKHGARGCVDVQPSRSLQHGVFTEGTLPICSDCSETKCTTDVDCVWLGDYDTCCVNMYQGDQVCGVPMRTLNSSTLPICSDCSETKCTTDVDCVWLGDYDTCCVNMYQGDQVCGVPMRTLNSGTLPICSDCSETKCTTDVDCVWLGDYDTCCVNMYQGDQVCGVPMRTLNSSTLPICSDCSETKCTTDVDCVWLGDYDTCCVNMYQGDQVCGVPMRTLNSGLNDICRTPDKFTITYLLCKTDANCKQGTFCCFGAGIPYCVKPKSKALLFDSNPMCPPNYFPNYFTEIPCSVNNICPNGMICCLDSKDSRICAYPKTKSLISECYKMGDAVDYRGSVNTTISGKACQYWTSQIPHKHARTTVKYPDKGLGDHNLCRNPDGEVSAWCYTTDPTTRYEMCDIGNPGENCGTPELNSMCPESNNHVFFTNIACSSDNECEEDLLCCFRESVGQVCAFSKTKNLVTELNSLCPLSSFPGYFTNIACGTDDDCPSDLLCCHGDNVGQACAFSKTKSLISECYKIENAVDYRGAANTTISGKACQSWTSQTPHKHTRRQDRYPDSGVGDHNLCRNPDKESSAWCYTTDPKTRWEVCDIGRPGQNCGLELNSMCPKSNKHMFFTNIPCSSDNECEDDLLCCFRESAGQVCAFSKTKEIKSEWHSEKYPECFRMADAVDYRGSVNTTETGKACQPWTSQTPHGHTRTSVNYPDMGLGDHNLCRNPDREPFAWCYTADPTSRWEVCDIGKPGENCGGTENNPTLLPGFHLSGYECNTVHDCINIFGPNAICCNSNGHLVCAEPTYAKSLISEKPKSIVDKTLSDLRPDQIIPEAEDRIRFCVPSACEYKKCQRMVNELIYNLIPRQDWRCIQAESREHCAYLVSKRFADVAVARVDGIYTAIKKYKLKPIAYEAPVIKGSSESEALNVWESITLAITKRDNSDISRWSDLRGKKSCHAGIKEIFSFKAPVCSLIQKDIIPRNGDYVESASQYFSGSCVPGILDEKYNVQSTYPLKLCDVCAKNNGLCGISDRYAGIEGSLQCIDESKGQVTFIDNKSLEKIIADGGASKYKVVCEGESIDLENDANSWKTNKACHLAVTPRPTVMVSPHKTADYISTVMDLLAKASKNYGKKSVSSFKLFESLSYKCQISEGVYEKDVIFRDAEAQEIREFVPIGDKPFAADYIQEYSSCMKMVPQPRAKFCVVTRAAFDKCLKIKENFDKTELVNTVAWGCVLKPSKMECMRAVQEGSADLLSTDATETFIAGREFKLQPILSQYFDTLTTDIYPGITKNAFNDTTYTYTIGIMKKDRFYDLYGADTREITSLRDLNTCHAGMKKLSSFHHPIGWLLANGTVPRIGSIFESVKRYFGRSCLPGSDPAIWRMDADLLMGHEINWGFRSLNFYNFTGFDWFIWNSPATWNYYNWNKYTPATLKSLLELVDEEVGISRVEHGEHEDIDWDMLEDILNYPDGLMSPELDDPPINMFNSKRKESDKQIRRKILSYALQTRTERMEKLGEIMQLLHNIPTLQDIRTDDEDWLSHPAVQSYLQIYFPSMVGFTSEIFEDAEIRKREFNRYNNPIWLSSGYADFVNTMQSYQKDMCSSCIGYGDKKCQETTAEPYYDYAGALACLEEKGGDISFFEAQEFQKLLNADSSKRPEEYILVCPTGAIRLYEKDVSVVEQCNFGRVPYPAVVTGQERTGTWRWEVTKAILEAQKTFGVVQHREQQHEAQFTIFGVNSVFDVATTEVKPIDILDQIYEVYIGQNLLRSMEAIIKPSNLDWWKEDAHKCYGETYSSVIVERQGGCNAVIKDLICIGAPPAKVLSVGRSGVKKAVTTEMCSRPTKHIKKPAEFTCEDGEGYTKYVDVAVNCECVPCEDVTYTLEWTKDSYWKSDAKTYQRNRGTTKETDYNLWGNRLEGRSI